MSEQQAAEASTPAPDAAPMSAEERASAFDSAVDEFNGEAKATPAAPAAPGAPEKAPAAETPAATASTAATEAPQKPAKETPPAQPAPAATERPAAPAAQPPRQPEQPATAPKVPDKPIFQTAIDSLLAEELPDPTNKETGKTTVDELRKDYPQIAGYVEKLVSKIAESQQALIAAAEKRAQELEARLKQYEPTLDQARAGEQQKTLDSLLAKVAEGDEGIANAQEILAHPKLAEWFKAQSPAMQEIGNNSTDPDEVRFFLARAAKAIGVEIKRGAGAAAPATSARKATTKPADNSTAALRTTLRGTGGGSPIPSGEVSSRAEIRDAFNEAASEFENARKPGSRNRVV